VTTQKPFFNRFPAKGKIIDGQIQRLAHKHKGFTQFIGGVEAGIFK
jgi:hypothetical protein